MGPTRSGSITLYGLISESFPSLDYSEASRKTQSQTVGDPVRDELTEVSVDHCWIVLELLI